LSEKLQLLEPKNKAAIRKNWKPKKKPGRNQKLSDLDLTPFPPPVIYFYNLSFYSSTCDSHKAFKEEEKKSC
jgi:hypothetical protein